jgi:hypothetical protein
MPLDPNKLSRNELVQLINSTPLGECITRGRVNSQMNRAGRRWHDGRHIRLLDYLRWLVREIERPAKPKIDARAADLARKNTETWRSQNVAPVPDIVDLARRERARAGFCFFCETYFAAACSRPWSEDHLRVIEKIERAVKEGGLFAFAMPRGSGKTTLARLSALWAVLSGYRPFVCLIGGSQEQAIELLTPIRKAVLENPLLLADFPEAVHPLGRLQNNARLLTGQVPARLPHALRAGQPRGERPPPVLAPRRSGGRRGLPCQAYHTDRNDRPRAVLSRGTPRDCTPQSLLSTVDRLPLWNSPCGSRSIRTGKAVALSLPGQPCMYWICVA